MKTYVLTLSQVFPATHPRKGEPTNLKVGLLNALYIHNPIAPIKLHTIRGNYELWRKCFEEIDAGNACLSIREWSGKPYSSKQIEIIRLTKEDGIGLQKLEFKKERGIMFPQYITERPIVRNMIVPIIKLSENDGLLVDDWRAWFESYDLSTPLAIIHFTKFRY